MHKEASSWGPPHLLIDAPRVFHNARLGRPPHMGSNPRNLNHACASIPCYLKHLLQQRSQIDATLETKLRPSMPRGLYQSPPLPAVRMMRCVLHQRMYMYTSCSSVLAAFALASASSTNIPHRRVLATRSASPVGVACQSSRRQQRLQSDADAKRAPLATCGRQSPASLVPHEANEAE